MKTKRWERWGNCSFSQTPVSSTSAPQGVTAETPKIGSVTNAHQMELLLKQVFSSNVTNTKVLSLRTHKSEIYKDWAGSLSSGPARLGPSHPLLCGELLLGGPCVLLPSQVGAPWGRWKCCHNTNPPEESSLGLKNFFWELPSFFPGDLPEVFAKVADLLPKNLTRGAAFTIPKVPSYTLPLLGLLLPN